MQEISYEYAWAKVDVQLQNKEDRNQFHRVKQPLNFSQPLNTSPLSFVMVMHAVDISAVPSMSISTIPFQVTSPVVSLTVRAPQLMSAGWTRWVVKLRELVKMSSTLAVKPARREIVLAVQDN